MLEIHHPDILPATEITEWEYTPWAQAGQTYWLYSSLSFPACKKNQTNAGLVVLNPCGHLRVESAQVNETKRSKNNQKKPKNLWQKKLLASVSKGSRSSGEVLFHFSPKILP